jgi:hypothetical protein
MSPDTLHYLLRGSYERHVAGPVMIAVGLLLIWLAIAKEYEPLLLLPIGAGAILANLPLSPMVGEHGRTLHAVLYNMGVGNELFPLLIFVGIGAMTDFGPLLENPKMVLLGAAGQFGIFLTLMLALLLGFTTTRPPRSASSVPSTVRRRSTCRTAGPRAARADHGGRLLVHELVPIIMPPIMRLLTTQKERAIRMPYTSREISQRTRILFPIMVTIVVGIAGAVRDAADRHADARQPDARVEGRRAAGGGVVERAGQRRDAVPGPGDRLDDGRPEASSTWRP